VDGGVTSRHDPVCEPGRRTPAVAWQNCWNYFWATVYQWGAAYDRRSTSNGQ